jgi:hypothetical protein
VPTTPARPLGITTEDVGTVRNGAVSRLALYWAWNNTLSVIQQSIIMQKHGAKIELFDNVKKMFKRKKAGE